ncbi:sulfite exporter TauE/SafE family protein [Saccharopolyspora mangrovi]|uniref:Uncharacterized protein n=1 Tax=Saccharopolyspora mangrovi TaxID=3082379 RepID=A0ABU6AF95_9PSEU|nr:hypothetical protein [Saccharopolyspora sp. S2-29]MEB3370138.1 hypothetical protein [Saccharopolyspora sp. S2-29]
MLVLKNYLGRKTAQPPKWLGELLSATPVAGLKTGLPVILAMPSDILSMLTVGANLEHHKAGFGAALPFIFFVWARAMRLGAPMPHSRTQLWTWVSPRGTTRLRVA